MSSAPSSHRMALSSLSVSVEIYRDAVGNEPRGATGSCSLDMAPSFTELGPMCKLVTPNYPNANAAGWGYQLLTSVLPNNGNGTFQLHAIGIRFWWQRSRTRAPGKTITCTNATAARPFGTIDTPGQGGDGVGQPVPQLRVGAHAGAPFKIPTDGSTITVMVDGAPLGHPTYNQYRSDVASAFPNYTNSQGAVGFAYLDTTQSWRTACTRSVGWCYDDHNRGEGIGSRYFTRRIWREMCRRRSGRSIWQPDREVRIRSGFDMNHEPEALHRDQRGGYSIRGGGTRPDGVACGRERRIFASGWKNGAAAGWINAEGRRALLATRTRILGRISARVDSSRSRGKFQFASWSVRKRTRKHSISLPQPSLRGFERVGKFVEEGSSLLADTVRLSEPRRGPIIMDLLAFPDNPRSAMLSICQ